MPVLSESTSSSLPSLDLPYVFIGGSLLIILGVIITRKSKSKSPKTTMSLPPIPEKSPLPNQETHPPAPPMTFPQHHHLSRLPQPLPFTPPTLSPTIFPAPPAPLFTSFPPSTGSGGLNASYYDLTSSPLELESSPSTSLPTEPPALSNQGTAGPRLPRRRSYTKTLSTSSVSSTGSTSSGSVVVSGEVIQAEGWRRHTRVFGGGVCKACEESERRMSA